MEADLQLIHDTYLESWKSRSALSVITLAEQNAYCTLQYIKHGFLRVAKDYRTEYCIVLGEILDKTCDELKHSANMVSAAKKSIDMCMMMNMVVSGGVDKTSKDKTAIMAVTTIANAVRKWMENGSPNIEVDRSTMFRPWSIVMRDDWAIADLRKLIEDEKMAHSS